MAEAEAELCPILIAAADVELCASLRDSIELEPYQVDVVHSGQAALAACRANDCDVLLLDVHLPTSRVPSFWGISRRWRRIWKCSSSRATRLAR